MRYIALLVFLTGFGGTARAETLADYVDQFAEHPQIASILQESARFRELSDGALGLPDPVVMLGVDNVPTTDPAFDRFLPTSKVIGLQQKIPSFALREANSRKHRELAAKHDLIAGYTRQRLEAILVAMLAQLDKVKQQKAYAYKQLKHYKALESYFRGKLESGSSIYWRFSEVDVERSMVERQLNDLQAERDGIEAELIRLVGEVPDIPLPIVKETGWSGSPESIYPVRIARQDVDIADRDVDAAEAAFGPDYGINALYKQRESGVAFNGDDWFSLQFSVSIPLWSEWSQKPKLRAANAGKRSAEYRFRDTMRQWTRQLTALASQRDAAANNVRLLVNEDRALGEMIDAAERNYQAGTADLDTVIDAQINRLTIKSQLAGQRARRLVLAAEFNSYIYGGEE